MTIENLFCGILGSIIATIIITIVSKVYLGVADFRGLKNTIRLIRDSYKGGIINIFPNRKFYIQHKDHGTETQYISKCENKLMYIGYWLAHGTEMGDVIETLKTLAYKKKDVEVILLNPDNSTLIEEMADFLKIDSMEMKQRIKNSLAKLCKIKDELPNDTKSHFSIKLHDIPLNASAFLIDYDNRKRLRLLVDYKIYNQERERSYGIEFKNGDITQNLCDSYRVISRNAKLYYE